MACAAPSICIICDESAPGARPIAAIVLIADESQCMWPGSDDDGPSARCLARAPASDGPAVDGGSRGGDIVGESRLDGCCE